MSHVEELSARYGWPLKIRARGYIAYLVGAQPMNEGDPEPIYRLPGGDSFVDKCEMVSASTRYQIIYGKNGLPLATWKDDPDEAKELAAALRKTRNYVTVWEHNEKGSHKTEF